MAFFEQLGKKVSDVGRGVTQQAKTMSDTAKLNSEISKTEKEIQQAYSDLGRVYYEKHVKDDNAENKELIKRITEGFEKIEQLRIEVKNVRGIVTCPECGAENQKNALFCSSCGAKLLYEPAPSDKTASISRFCPECGAAVSETNKFCVRCGHNMEADIATPLNSNSAE